MSTADKILDILEVLLESNREVGIMEIAELSGINSSSAHRILTTLVNRGYLIQPYPRGKYSLGYKFLAYGASVEANLNLVDIAKPIMQELTKDIGESVSIAIPDSYAAVQVGRVEVNRVLKISPQIGRRIPLHNNGPGKILLSLMEDQDIDKFLKESKLTRETKHTITDPSKLLTEIKKIRKTGVAYDDEEAEIGVRCVAAPVNDSLGLVKAALSMIGPSTRISKKRLKELAVPVAKSAADISRLMGFKSKQHFKNGKDG